MMDGKRPTRISTACPRCDRRIGLMAGLKAGTPFALKCPHCKTTLIVRMRGLIPFVLAITALISLSVWGVHPIFVRFGSFWTGLYVVFLLVGWFALEIATGVILFTHARFTPINWKRRGKRTKEIL
jgi:hypothetical protein